MGLTDLFNWRSAEKHNPTKQDRRNPAPIDWTDGMQVNRSLTTGLYHNQYTGMKLAGSLAFNPIAIPVWFMGLPVPESADEQTQEKLAAMMADFGGMCKQLHIECHRDGTVWVWPHYSASAKRLIWEVIPDESVQSIVRSAETGEIVELYVAEQLTVSLDDQRTATAIRTRIFSADRIIERWSGQALPEQIKGKAMRNVSGILPIAFANNADAREVRGHSDYERIIYDLKDYHDIDLMQSTILAKFTPKMLWYVSNAKDALANNGYDSISEIDISAADLFLPIYQKEEISFAFPQNAYEAYESVLKRKFRKIVEGSGIPEICWGIKTEGNHASAEEQMGMLVQFVQDKREQITHAYEKLFNASLRIMSIVDMASYDLGASVAWGSLDGLSEKTKAEIFSLFASGVSSLVSSAGASKQQLYSLWDRLYPESTTEDFHQWEVGISRMAKHKQWTGASYLEALDLGEDGNVE